jgi:hypothetical protein
MLIMEFKKVPIASFDIDNTILSNDPADGPQKPLPNRIKRLTDLRKRGVFIVLYTARPYSEYERTIGEMMYNGIPFNVLHMGKLNVPVHVDDKMYNADRFEDVCDKFMSLPIVAI